jgi:hypothetical protein
LTLARLLSVTLLFCAFPAFSQERQTAQIPGNGVSAFVTNRDAASTPSEPWRIVPNPPSDLSSHSMNHIRVDQYRLDQSEVDFRTGRSKLETKTRTLVMGLDGPLDGDTTCYTIRSYVVARDSKDSDSTHMTGYSTCQPASRYRVKTTVGRGPVSLER